jgi:hypothetical protein
MMTQYKCALNDDQRRALAIRLGLGNRLIKRAELVEFLDACIAGALAAPDEAPSAPAMVSGRAGSVPHARATVDGDTIDLTATHGDPHLIDKSIGYRIGWNKWKFRDRLGRKN